MSTFDVYEAELERAANKPARRNADARIIEATIRRGEAEL